MTFGGISIRDQELENPEIELARRYVEGTGVSLFLTGKAGTGKTTFLRDIDAHTAKRHVVLAPTGVAAVNAGGVTIHSFFQLPFDPYLPDVKELVTEYQMPEGRKSLSKQKTDIIRTLELLIIDEVSMVRADLMDAIDMMLRRVRRNSRPFGGVQLLLIGDVHQLAPVVTEKERSFMERVYPSPYFFNSKALQRMEYVTIELTKVYRQQDAAFVELLNHVRDNRLDGATLQALNSRVSTQAVNQSNKQAITLTTHNRQADAINRRHMDALTGECRRYEAVVKGNCPEGSLPVERELELKVGERVMFVKNGHGIEGDRSGGNDYSGLRYYNGMLATVTGFVSEGENEAVATVNDDGEEILVGRELWEYMRYSINEQTGEIAQEVDGSFSQYPLRAAWAVTIHKAQGLTFDRVTIDAADAFAFGQVYVALSRCRSLEGLSLSTALTAGVAFGDTSVAQFSAGVEANRHAVAESVVQKEDEFRLEKLMELFEMEDVLHDGERLLEHYGKLRPIYPEKVDEMRSQVDVLTDLQAVSERFKVQLMRLDEKGQNERAVKGAGYYHERLAAVAASLLELLEVEIENKATRKQVKETGEQLKERLGVKVACMEAVGREGYSVATVQRARTKALLGGGKKEKREVNMEMKVDETLAGLLKRWRKAKADMIGKPPFMIFNQKALVGLTTMMPRTEKELLMVPGIGKAKAAQFGSELLDLIANYREAYGVR